MIHLEFYRLSQHSQQLPVDQRKVFIAQQKKYLHELRLKHLSHYVGKELQATDLVKTPHGKPYLAAHSLEFNHSHSAKHYVLAVSRQQHHLGVDVEDLDRNVNFDALARHAFHPAEYALWQSLDYDTQLWFRIWTVKEAILKASGLGIRLSLNTLNTQIHPEQNSGTLIDERLGTFAFQSLQVGGAMVSIAWKSGLGCGEFQIPRLELHIHDQIVLVEPNENHPK